MQEVADYLISSHDADSHEAMEAATQVAPALLGGAWVLSEVSAASDDEPIYQFLHHTLQEYFAARELTRRFPTADALAAALAANLKQGGWEATCLMAVELHARQSKESGEGLARRLLQLAKQGAVADDGLLTHFLRNVSRRLMLSPELREEFRAVVDE